MDVAEVVEESAAAVEEVVAIEEAAVGAAVEDETIEEETVKETVEIKEIKETDVAVKTVETDVSEVEAVTDVTKAEAVTEVTDEEAVTDVTKVEAVTEVTDEEAVTDVTKVEAVTDVTDEEAVTDVTDEEAVVEESAAAVEEVVAVEEASGSGLLSYRISEDDEGFDAFAVLSNSSGVVFSPILVSRIHDAGESSMSIAETEDMSVGGVEEFEEAVANETVLAIAEEDEEEEEQQTSYQIGSNGIVEVASEGKRLSEYQPRKRSSIFGPDGYVNLLSSLPAQPSSNHAAPSSSSYGIVGFSVVKSVVMYHINVIDEGDSRRRMPIVFKRFSQFSVLYSQLLASRLPHADELPPFPKVTLGTFLRGRQSKRTIEAREKAFMAILAFISGHQELSESSIFQKFVVR